MRLSGVKAIANKYDARVSLQHRLSGISGSAVSMMRQRSLKMIIVFDGMIATNRRTLAVGS